MLPTWKGLIVLFNVIEELHGLLTSREKVGKTVPYKICQLAVESLLHFLKSRRGNRHPEYDLSWDTGVPVLGDKSIAKEVRILGGADNPGQLLLQLVAIQANLQVFTETK